MIFFGYLLTSLLGLSLGVLGAGGSILTVPILVYLFGLPATVATGASLLVVGTVSLVGSVSAFKSGQLDHHKALAFAPASILGAIAARTFLLPQLPGRVWGIGRDSLLLIAFALLMLAAARAMFQMGETEGRSRAPMLMGVLTGFLVGLLTGFLGAGGGFLIVPALSLLLGVEMTRAVGTSLAIIAANALLAFGSDVIRGIQYPWTVLTLVIVIALFGMLVGTRIRDRLDPRSLRRAFAIFVTSMAVLILVRESVGILT